MIVEKEEYQPPQLAVYEMETEGVLAASSEVIAPAFGEEQW